MWVCVFTCYVTSRYYRANSVRYHQSTSSCDASCAHTHYCAITRLDYTDFRSCLETAASALASEGTNIKSIHCIFQLFSLVALLQLLGALLIS